MKKLFICCILALLGASASYAQSAHINLTVTDREPFKGIIALRDPSASYDQTKAGKTTIKLNNQSAAVAVNALHPHYISFTFAYSTGQIRYGDKMIEYHLFVSPGDDLNLKIDLTKTDKGLIVTGKGANNNQPSANSFTDIFSGNDLRQEKSPYPVIAAINKEQRNNQKVLDDYIAKYKPSATFIRANSFNVKYYAAAKYFFIKTANLDESHNAGAWQKVQDSLFAAVKLNNEAALVSGNYTQLISFFLERKKEQLWGEQHDNPQAFYKEWYNTDTVTGKKIFADERTNLLQEKIINRYFSGKTAEYLYSAMIRENLNEADYHNIEVLYAHFKAKYPQSEYLAQYNAFVTNYLEKSKLKLNDKMLFAPGNGSKLNTLKEVADLYKGKVVFVDMWGTWCGPCREEIEAKSELLRDHFKGKDVVFLFVSNRDIDREDEWKKLIAYYQMEGSHILANMKLTRDIMTQIKVNGFPSYFIIEKDGTVKKTVNQYQYDLNGMESEISAAL